MQASSAEPLARDTEHRSRADARHDLIFRLLLRFCALIVLATLLGAALSTLWGGREVLFKDGLHFLFSSEWNPVEDRYGALAPIVGTLATSLIALVFAVPISFGIALFLTEIAPNWMRGPIATAIELLAAIPSIIYGMWGLFIFVPFMSNIEPWLNDTLGNIPLIGQLFQGPPLGLGLLTAGIVLAVMILPIISAVTREVFVKTPQSHIEAALALGATRWEVVKTTVLPFGRSGYISGAMLGLGRALGETVALLIILRGTQAAFGWSLFDGGYTFATKIAATASEFNDQYKAGAYIAAGLVLFLLTFVVNAMARAAVAGKDIR